MKVLLACGGTGGHVFPGVAIAEKFRDVLSESEILFVGTPRGMEKKIIGQTDWRLEMMEAASFADKKGWDKIRALGRVLKSLKGARDLLKREEPNLVIGVGGYAAAPILLMASLMGKPTVTIEPNAYPGLSNRLMRHFVDRVIVAYPGMEKFFGRKTRQFGVPVRKGLFENSIQTPLPDARCQMPDRKTILVFGGSQGARRINESVVASLDFLADLKGALHFIHLIGDSSDTTDPASYEKIYKEKGFSAEIHSFIEKMGPLYKRADFVIGRAGGNTVAELMAFNKPSLLIPYPHAAANHQEINARSLEEEGGVKVLLDAETNGGSVSKVIRDMVKSPQLLETMCENLSKLGNRDAAGKIVEECLELVGRG